jgi:hypothetical protein
MKYNESMKAILKLDMLRIFDRDLSKLALMKSTIETVQNDSSDHLKYNYININFTFNKRNSAPFSR